MRQFFGRWRFERCVAHTNRAAGIEHRPHRAVLAGTVDALQHDQQRTFALGKQPVLQCIDRNRIFGGCGFGLILVLQASPCHADHI